MNTVHWLKYQVAPCEATLASDEMETWKPDQHCNNVAELHITYNNLQAQNTCYHHYITRTAFPNRTIGEAI